MRKQLGIVALTLVGCLLVAGMALAGEHGAEQKVTVNGGLQVLATALFAIAVLHTFLVGRFKEWAHHFEEGSIQENLLHLLGETEAVFLLWAAALFSAIAAMGGWHEAIHYIEHLDYTEPKFVFIIMVIAATRPVVEVVDAAIRMIGRVFQAVTPFGESQAFLLSALIVGPLLGSFVTEPAAMTVTAMVLKRQYFDRGISMKLMYAVLGTLFVNVSIGGVLTNFAAPPVLMVAKTWGWTTEFMFVNFGWKAIIAVCINALIVTLAFGRELRELSLLADSDAHNGDAGRMPVPWWVKVVHLVSMGFVVLTGHHADVCFGVFVVFLGFVAVTKEFQESLKLKESLLVGGFLAGLVTMGGLQDWWLRPLLGSLSEFPLFVGCTGLTAVTDNAALTYLGSQVEGLSDDMKYALVAGAVTGGGLTVIANAPNPAGYSILSPSFEARFGSGVSPLWLLLGAALPTAVAFVCFWCL
jgi:hypothetical protein